MSEYPKYVKILVKNQKEYQQILNALHQVVIADIVKENLKKDNNFKISISGERGNGMSGNALTLANKIDPKYTVEDVLFSKEDHQKRCHTLGFKKRYTTQFKENQKT